MNIQKKFDNKAECNITPIVEQSQYIDTRVMPFTNVKACAMNRLTTSAMLFNPGTVLSCGNKQ
jgi:hypothetical protein